MSLVGVTGCGGGERQDKNEEEGTYDVSVVKAQFPAKQSIAGQEEMTITVRNTGQEPVPVISVSLGQTDAKRGHIEALTERKASADLADPERPIWIVDEAPTGGEVAYVGTWALGTLPPGETKTFTWKLTPVVAGRHKVKYTINAGLDGKAKATSNGRTPGGVFDVSVRDAPASSTVDPDTGEVRKSS